MDDNPDLPDEERGLYAKYDVFKRSDDGTPSVRVTDPGMFLKFDDPAAQDALFVYANSVKKKYPRLAADIKEQIYAAVERAQAFLAELDEAERLGLLHAGVHDGPSLKELASRPDAAVRYLEGLDYSELYIGPDPEAKVVYYKDGNGEAVRFSVEEEVCVWSGKAHLRQHDHRSPAVGCGWRTLHDYTPGAWPNEEADDS